MPSRGVDLSFAMIFMRSVRLAKLDGLYAFEVYTYIRSREGADERAGGEVSDRYSRRFVHRDRAVTACFTCAQREDREPVNLRVNLSEVVGDTRVTINGGRAYPRQE